MSDINEYLRGLYRRQRFPRLKRFPRFPTDTRLCICGNRGKFWSGTEKRNFCSNTCADWFLMFTGEKTFGWFDQLANRVFRSHIWKKSRHPRLRKDLDNQTKRKDFDGHFRFPREQ